MRDEIQAPRCADVMTQLRFIGGTIHPSCHVLIGVEEVRDCVRRFRLRHGDAIGIPGERRCKFSAS